MNMVLNIDLVPSGPYEGTVVLIDVLRTCTTAPLLLDRGASSVALTPSLRVAKSVAAASRALLVGERQGVPPEGFNHGNSPGPLAGLDLAGREVVMVSENAPKWLDELGKPGAVFLGSLYNASAVVDAIMARGDQRVDLVCSGFAGEPDLDDAVAAALISKLLQREAPLTTMRGAARLALAIAKGAPDPFEALWRSTAGRYLRQLGLEDDIAFASRISVSRAVPELTAVHSVGHSFLYTFSAGGHHVTP